MEKLVILTNEKYYKQQYLPIRVKENEEKSEDDIKSSVKSYVSFNNEKYKIDINKIVMDKIDLSENF